MTRGWAMRNDSTAGPARTRQRIGRVATTSAMGVSPEQDRDLAEEVAAGQARPLRAVDDDRRLAVEDHVEPGAAQALAEDPLALAEDGLVEGVDDALELRRRQVGEQREPGDRIDEFLAAGHASTSFAPGIRPSDVRLASCHVAVCAGRHRAAVAPRPSVDDRRRVRLTPAAERRSMTVQPPAEDA